MKIKTKSRIQRFLEEKNYGICFGRLMPFVSSMHSCQPQQAIKPSNPVILSRLKLQRIQINLPKVVPPMIPTQKGNVRVLSFQFMKLLKGKENTQALKI